MREIVEDGRVQAALDAAMGQWDGCEFAWEAITWALARDPSGAGDAINEAGTAFVLEYAGAMSNGQPTIRVLYSIEDQRVVIHDAEFTRPVAPFAGRG